MSDFEIRRGLKLLIASGLNIQEFLSDGELTYLRLQIGVTTVVHPIKMVHTMEDPIIQAWCGITNQNRYYGAGKNATYAKNDEELRSDGRWCKQCVTSIKKTATGEDVPYKNRNFIEKAKKWLESRGLA